MTGMDNNFAATPVLAPGTQITTGGTPHVKTGYTELIAATTYNTSKISISLGGTLQSATRTDFLVDIAVGAAGSEVDIIKNILAGWAGNLSAGSKLITLPINIPAGSRIAARAQSLIAADVVSIFVALYGGTSSIVRWNNDIAAGPAGKIITAAESLGIDTALSIGLSHTPGDSGAESTWTNWPATAGSGTQAAAVTTRDYYGILPMIGGSLSQTTMTSIAYHVELGVGSTTYGEWHFTTSTAEQVFGPFPASPIMRYIPAGTQLQLRAEASGVALPLDMAILALY